MAEALSDPPSQSIFYVVRIKKRSSPLLPNASVPAC